MEIKNGMVKQMSPLLKNEEVANLIGYANFSNYYGSHCYDIRQLRLQLNLISSDDLFFSTYSVVDAIIKLTNDKDKYWKYRLPYKEEIPGSSSPNEEFFIQGEDICTGFGDEIKSATEISLRFFRLVRQPIYQFPVRFYDMK